MSMLAEPKRKQKWSLNPRGKEWAQDTNKFGHKMLEKMGWSHGKGLGAKENGRTEHIKVSYKNDSKGMGYKESDNQWTEHESKFSELLEALGGGDSKENEIKLKSLEKKSEQSRVRVHYRKFTRGKDLSRCSEKDLANIFGKKTLNGVKKEVKEEDNKIEDEESESKEKSKMFSHGGLISDYFKKKLHSFGKTNGYVVGNNGVLTKPEENSESESELRPSFGFGFSQKEESSDFNSPNSQDSSRKTGAFISYIYNNENEDTPKKKKKDKKRALEEDDSLNVNETPSKKKKQNSSDSLEESSAKKKKEKSTKKPQNEDQSGLLNPAFDPLYSPITHEKHILEPIEESLSETLNDTVGQVAENFEVNVQINNESTPQKRKWGESESECKIKIKRRSKTEIMETSEEIISNDQAKVKKKKKKYEKTEEIFEEMDISIVNTSEQSFDNEVKPEKKKKKKKSKAQSIESLASENDNQSSEESYKVKEKRKKKKQKENCGLENPAFNENDSSIISQDLSETGDVKLKKKKKKGEAQGLDNPALNISDINCEDVKEKPQKKKKKKKKDDTQGLDNPALNLNDTIEESIDLMLNVVATPVAPKENINETFTIHSAQSIKRRKSVRFSDVTRERIIPPKEESEQETLDDTREIIEVEGKLNDSQTISYLDKFLPKKKSKKKQLGLDNTAFDQQAATLEENINSISNTLDTYQAEIENDMNEERLKSSELEDIMVGEVGNPNGTNEILPDGSVKLTFKNAKFSKTSRYVESLTGPKKSYKHLIKGDIVVGFKNTNLHTIEGYATTKSG